MRVLIFLILFALLPRLTIAGQVAFRSKTVVDGAQLTLGKVADLSGLPEAARKKLELITLLSTNTLPEHATIRHSDLAQLAVLRDPIFANWFDQTRKSDSVIELEVHKQRVLDQQIFDVALDAVRANCIKQRIMNCKPMIVGSIKETLVPTGLLEMKVVAISGLNKLDSDVRAKVEILVDRIVQRAIVVKLQVEGAVMSKAITRPILKGETVSLSDVTDVLVHRQSARRGNVTYEPSTGLLRAASTIAEGFPLNNLDGLALFKRGDDLVNLVTVGATRVSREAFALRDTPSYAHKLLAIDKANAVNLVDAQSVEKVR